MNTNLNTEVRKQSQSYAYTSIKMHETVAKKAGFSGTDHKYLGFLLQKGQMTAGELANLTGLTSGAVTGLIDRFEKKKLVVRRYTDGDRRIVIIIPDTQKIMALLAPLYKDFRDKSEKLISLFSEEELKTIAAYFEKSIEIMTETIDSLK
jgi:DNA-binding MarR family transcriptional regulator